MKDPWVKCTDLPLTIFENAATMYRNHSLENRYSFDKENIGAYHNNALDHLVSKYINNILCRNKWGSVVEISKIR
jgi:hypothetical protein